MIGKWVGLITPHARARFVERITSPNLFSHLSSRCRISGCPECVSLTIQLKQTIEVSRRYLDEAIRKRIWKAQQNNSRVTDTNFLEIVSKTYPSNRDFDFWQDDEGAVFVIVKPPDEPSPVLLTVLSFEMVDGFVIKSASKEELQNYFDRWKMAARQTTREIKELK